MTKGIWTSQGYCYEKEIKIHLMVILIRNEISEQSSNPWWNS